MTIQPVLGDSIQHADFVRIITFGHKCKRLILKEFCNLEL